MTLLIVEKCFAPSRCRRNLMLTYCILSVCLFAWSIWGSVHFYKVYGFSFKAGSRSDFRETYGHNYECDTAVYR